MFKLDEIVMVKRTHGAWEEGKIVDVLHGAVVIEVDVTDMMQGYEYTGEPKKKDIKQYQKMAIKLI